jgi:hypothetical protein
MTAVAVPLATQARAADGAPVITVTPNTGIASGQTLAVTGSGFPAKAETAYVVECSGTTPSSTSCDGNTVQMPTTGADGTFTANITVHSGPVGDGTCNAGQTCTISATTDISWTIPNTSASAPITFAATQPVSKFATVLFAQATAKGSKVTVSGTISAQNKGVKGLAVTVYERAKGSKKWKTAGTTTSKANGTVKLKGLKHFSHKEQYQVRHATETVKTVVYEASKSAVSTVK